MRKFLKFIFGLIVVFAILAVIGRIFLFELAHTSSYSMVPNLVSGDLFLMRTVGLLGQGDIAVCENPEDSSSLVVLRVMGIPGDTVALWKNHLKINGEVLQHNVVDPISYSDTTSDETLDYDVKVAIEHYGGRVYEVALMERGSGKQMDEVSVPEDYFFVVGDNRNMARDSRNFGMVPIDSCLGSAFFLLWPGDDSGTLMFKNRLFTWL